MTSIDYEIATSGCMLISSNEKFTANFSSNSSDELKALKEKIENGGINIIKFDYKNKFKNIFLEMENY